MRLLAWHIPCISVCLAPGSCQPFPSLHTTLLMDPARLTGGIFAAVALDEGFNKVFIHFTIFSSNPFLACIVVHLYLSHQNLWGFYLFLYNILIITFCFLFFFSRLSSHAGLIYFPFSNLVQQVTCTVVVFAMISFRNLHAARKGLIVLAISFGVILRSFIFFI